MTKVIPLRSPAPRWRTVSLDMDRATAEALTARGEFGLALEYLRRSLFKRIDHAFDTLHALRHTRHYADLIPDPADRAAYLTRTRLEIEYAAHRQLRGDA